MEIPNTLKKLGITSFWQVAMVMPKKYKDYSNVIQNFRFDSLPIFYESESLVFQGEIIAISEIRFIRDKRSPYITVTLMGLDRYTLKIFINASVKELMDLISSYSLGGVLCVSGKPNLHRGEFLLKSPLIVQAADMQCIHVEYSLSNGKKAISKAEVDFIRDNMDIAIVEACKKIRAALASSVNRARIIKEYLKIEKGVTIETVLNEIHYPTILSKALFYQLVIEKIAALMVVKDVVIGAKKWGKQRKPLLPYSAEKRINDITFKMTHEQISCAKELLVLFSGNYSQKAMLIGDVGSGKSCVMGVVAASMCDAGGKVAVLLPSQNLAIQLHQEFNEFFPDLAPKLLIEGVHEDEGKSNLWIGTTALLFKHWQSNFDLVIADEQHKYSVQQREFLCESGAHLLESTATPVPRSAALLKNGILNQYRLTKCFVDKTLITSIYSKNEKSALFNKAIQNLRSGNKLLVVCALKEESKSDAMAAIANAEEAYRSWMSFVEKFRDKLPMKTGVSLAHGGRSQLENQHAIDEFKKGQVNIMIATTIFETGITVEKLTHLIIMNPERLGLVQLHQLRGRLARFGGVGYFDMYLEKTVSVKTEQRLNLLCQSTDGLYLATEDIKLRGFGDLTKSGLTQTGSNSKYIFGRTIEMDHLEHASHFLR
jgi:ATP-dependent DNA helicase RecG